MPTCPNCNKDLYKGIINKNELLPQDTVDFINKELGLNNIGYCDTCGTELLHKIENNHSNIDEAKDILRKIDKKINIRLGEYIKNMPALTLETPFNWNYSSIGFVSSQVVVGTGMVAEIASSFTDFFGENSAIYAEKISKGEEYCIDKLKLNACALGGNAILGIKMSYGQAGGLKGMLMICATATAVKLLNTDIFENNAKISLDDFKEIENLSAFKREIYRALHSNSISDFFKIYDNNIIKEIKEKFK